MKPVAIFFLSGIIFSAVHAEDILAPELHYDPFTKPLLSAEEQIVPILEDNQDTGAQAPRSAFLWKPELRGIIHSSDIATVNIDGNMISMGEELEGYRLIKVKERSVVFEKNGTYYPLSLDSPEQPANAVGSSL